MTSCNFGWVFYFLENFRMGTRNIITESENDFVKVFETVESTVNEYSRILIDVESFLFLLLKNGEPINQSERNLYLTSLIHQNEMTKAIGFLEMLEKLKAEVLALMRTIFTN